MVHPGSPTKPQANSARRSARRGRPGCFADLSQRRRRARRYSTRRYVGRPGAPRGDETITNSFLRPSLRQQPTRQWSPGETRTTNITRHEAEPAFSVAQSSLPHPYMRWTQQWIQTMMQYTHRQRGSEAAVAQSIDRHEGRGGTRATATSDRSWQIVASSASSAKS
jgi:hypothetical protein